MASLKLTVEDSEVRTAFKRAGLAVQNLPAKVVRPEVEQARDELREYPSELPGQKYRRTGRRYTATKVEAVAGNNQYSKSYRLVSNPRYPGGRTGNPFTVGDAKGQGQAKVHQGRWKLMADVMSAAMSRIVERGREYFRAVLERNGPP